MRIQTGIEHKTRKVQGKETLVFSEDLRADLIRLGEIVIQKSDYGIEDEGSCVSGGGICVDVVIGKKRSAVKMVFVENPYQGNVASTKSLKPVLDYINEHWSHINAYHYEGIMN